MLDHLPKTKSTDEKENDKSDSEDLHGLGRFDISEKDCLVDSPRADQSWINLFRMIRGQDKKATRSVDHTV